MASKQRGGLDVGRPSEIRLFCCLFTCLLIYLFIYLFIKFYLLADTTYRFKGVLGSFG